MCISSRPRLIIEEMGYQNKSYCPLLGEKQKRYEKLLYLFFLFLKGCIFFQPSCVQSASGMTRCYIYSRLSLSRNQRDPLKHFEISVLRHIRFVVLRKKQFEQPNFTNVYVM